MSQLNVLYQCDDAYARFLIGSVASLLENNASTDSVVVHVLDAGISAGNRALLESLCRRYQHAAVTFYPTDRYETLCSSLGLPPWRGKHITWYKLFALDDLQGVTADRVIYLNPHCLVNASLAGIDGIDFQGRPLALTADPNVTPQHKAKIALAPGDRYYNGGVMLIDYAKWRRDDITARNAERLRNKHDYPVVDQDYVNDVFRGDITYIGPQYCMVPMYWLNDIDMIYRTFQYTESNFHAKDDLLNALFTPVILYGRPITESARHRPFVARWNHFLRLAGVAELRQQRPSLLTFTRWGLPERLALPLLRAYLNRIT